MKKSYLAAAAILGAAVFAGEAHAVKLKYGDGKSFKMGFRAKINATYKGDRTDKSTNDDKSDLILSAPNARIYAKGSITKVFKWGWQGDFGKSGTFKIVDAFVTLDFAKEAKLYAGLIKVPFELHSGIQSGWSFMMPTGGSKDLANNPFKNPAYKSTTVSEQAPGSGSRSPQVGLWGKVADGMLKYYLYLVDGRDETDANKAGTGYGARIEFAPTMAGYKGHPGYVLKETYLGKQDTLSIGLSYFTEKTGDETASSFGVDAIWEQNLGGVTPNINVGYVDHKSFHGTKDDDRKGLVVQGQVLLNQKTMLGKPAVSFRYAQSDRKNKKKGNVLGVAAQLYVKGVGNRIALSIDRVNDDNKSGDDKKSWTDITLAFWYNF